MRNIVVTGGSRGLGLAIARRLAGDGNRVIAVARQSSPQLAAAIEQGAAIEFRAFDLSRVQDIQGFVTSLTAAFGPIFGLVNNAGLGTAGVLATMPDARIEELLRLNVLSPTLLTKYAARSMMVGGRGRIVNISSIVGATGYSGLSVYSGSKSSWTGFTKSLARELGPLGITVNNVAPGFIETDMTKDLEHAQLGQIARRSALKRLAVPEDVAAAVAFLFSDGAENITGTTLTVDAGNTA